MARAWEQMELGVGMKETNPAAHVVETGLGVGGGDGAAVRCGGGGVLGVSGGDERTRGPGGGREAATEASRGLFYPSAARLLFSHSWSYASVTFG